MVDLYIDIAIRRCLLSSMHLLCTSPPTFSDTHPLKGVQLEIGLIRKLLSSITVHSILDGMINCSRDISTFDVGRYLFSISFSQSLGMRKTEMPNCWTRQLSRQHNNGPLRLALGGICCDRLVIVIIVVAIIIIIVQL